MPAIPCSACSLLFRLEEFTWTKSGQEEVEMFSILTILIVVGIIIAIVKSRVVVPPGVCQDFCVNTDFIMDEFLAFKLLVPSACARASRFQRLCHVKLLISVLRRIRFKPLLALDGVIDLLRRDTRSFTRP